MNYWNTTVFYCDYWWGEKHAAFHAFDALIWQLIDTKNPNNGDFYYHVEADGFYLYCYHRDAGKSWWTLIHKWVN